MRLNSYLRSALCGLLVASVSLAAPRSASAQWTVFDPTNWALQIERQIEEANRWVERVNQYTNQINKMVEQIDNLRGILGQAEKLVLHNQALARTMASLGRVVRDAFAFKRALEQLITSRLQMIVSIRDRLERGIFDPEADLRDLEEYLRTGLGRTAQDSIATNVRLASMDNTLERMNHDLRIAQAKKAGAVKEREQMKEQLEAELQKPEDAFCGSCVTTLQLSIQTLDATIINLDAEISRLVSAIEERVKKYNLTMQEREQVAAAAQGTDEAFETLNEAKEEVFTAIDDAEKGRLTP